MKLLLDTSLLLKAAAGAGLSPGATELINRRDTDPLFSAVSLLELGFRSLLSTDRKPIDVAEFRRELLESGYRELPLTGLHAAWAPNLPLHHGDPFDRLLVAQAIVEGISLYTENPIIMAYPGPILSAL